MQICNDYNYVSNIDKNSQEYSESYNVLSDMCNNDKRNKDVFDNDEYLRNPSSRDLQEAINDDKIQQHDGKIANGKYIYVLDMDNKIFFGLRKTSNGKDGYSPHPMLIGGKNPKVQCAGEIEIRDGKIYKVNHHSGHYKPNRRSLKKVKVYMQELYKKKPSLFHKDTIE